LHRFKVREIESLTSVRTLNCQTIIHPDDENFLSEPSFVSRSFELLKVASVRTSQQHGRTPFSVQQVKRFLSKTQIWEDSYNRPDDVCSSPDAILDKATCAKFNRQDVSLHGSDVQAFNSVLHKFNRPDVSLHGLDVALFKKEFQANLKSR
jgi:hypothetical protein